MSCGFADPTQQFLRPAKGTDIIPWYTDRDTFIDCLVTDPQLSLTLSLNNAPRPRITYDPQFSHLAHIFCGFVELLCRRGFHVRPELLFLDKAAQGRCEASDVNTGVSQNYAFILLPLVPALSLLSNIFHLH